MRILAVGAHTDDVELFCGGLFFREIGGGSVIRCVICTKGDELVKERMKEQELAWEFLGVQKGYFLGMRDRYLRHDGDLVTRIDEIIEEYKPEVVLSHSDFDSNQDHLAVAKCIRSANRAWGFSWVTYPSYDIRSSFVPNLFVNIDSFYEKKKKLLGIFKSQQGKWYFKEDVLLARSLGSNMGKYIEQFRLECGLVK